MSDHDTTRRVPDTADAAEVAAAEGATCPQCTALNRPGARWCRGCGADLRPEAGTDVVPAADAAPRWPRSKGQWMSTKQKRRAVWASGVLVLVLVLGGGFYFWQDTFYGGEEPVREFFDSLQAREGYTPPKNVEVGSFDYIDDGTEWRTGDCDHSKACRPDADRGAVDVTYSLDGKQYESSVVVSRESGGWFREWHLAETLNKGVLLVEAPPYVTQLEAAGTTWDAQPGWKKGEADTSVNLDPGVYEVGVPDNPLIEAEPVTVAVPIAKGPPGNRVATEATLSTVSIRDDAVDAVDKLVKKQLDKCADNDGTRDPGCGWSPEALLTDDDTIEWDLKSYPEIDLVLPEDAEGDSPGGQAIQVTTTEPGKAVMTYQRIQSDKTKTESVTVRVGGGVGVADGDIVWPMDDEDLD